MKKVVLAGAVESRFRDQYSQGGEHNLPPPPTLAHFERIVETYFDDDRKQREAARKTDEIEYLEKRYLNTNLRDYLKDCRALSPTHHVLSYKYPKQVNSRYSEYFRNHSRPVSMTRDHTATASPDKEAGLDGQRTIPTSMSENHFDYDKIRN